jgi:hypothetical protein
MLVKNATSDESSIYDEYGHVISIMGLQKFKHLKWPEVEKIDRPQNITTYNRQTMLVDNSQLHMQVRDRKICWENITIDQ